MSEPVLIVYGVEVAITSIGTEEVQWRKREN
jgi:hypothetical protein